jgi:hypothetical protein
VAIGLAAAVSRNALTQVVLDGADLLLKLSSILTENDYIEAVLQILLSL